MANKKITELAALTDPDANDLLAIVDDPSGSPVTKQITATKLVKNLNNQTATFVIAASDSLHKERADYICDGVDDQVEIQAAVDALPTSGGKVVLLEGTFNFTGVTWNTDILTITKSNVVIDGQGKATHIKVVGNEGHYVVFFNGVSNCVIRDVWVDGNALGGYAIHFTNSSECKVLNCIAGNTWADGIVGTNLSYSIIKGNTVYECRTSAHGDASSGIEIEDGSHHISVTDNIVYDCAIGIWHKQHSGASPTHHINISRNYVYGTTTSIVLTSEDAVLFLENSIIVNNTLIGGAQNISLGLRCKNILIQGNVMSNSSSHAITGGGTPTENIKIVENVIDTPGGGGMYIRQAKNVLVANNFITGVQSTTFASIQIDTPRAEAGVSIIGNIIKNSGYRGISIYASSQDVDLIISNNIIDSCQEEGIRVSNVHHGIIKGNIISNVVSASLPAIYILQYEGTTDYVQVILNDIHDSTLPILVMGNAHGIVRDNIGHTTKNFGSSTGTGAQQTIVHGLAATPTKVILWNIEDGANPYQSAVADGDNIYVLATINQDWGWEAEVV